MPYLFPVLCALGHIVALALLRFVLLMSMMLPDGLLVCFIFLRLSNLLFPHKNDVDLLKLQMKKRQFLGLLMKGFRRYKMKKWRTWAPVSFDTKKSPRPTRAKEICSISTSEYSDSKVNFSYFCDFELKSPRTLNISEDLLLFKMHWLGSSISSCSSRNKSNTFCWNCIFVDK